jgi:hypothetical protein
MCEFIQYRPDYMNLVMFEVYQHRDIFQDGLTAVIGGIKSIITEGYDDADINENIDYEWIIIQVYSVMHYLLKNKLLSENLMFSQMPMNTGISLKGNKK